MEFTQERIKALVLQRDLLHADETGVRIKGILHWVHVAATPFLTLYNWHRKRGQEAIDAIGLLPNFAGRVIHDRWASYDQYPCSHSLCGAHLLRDCLFVAEQEKQPWGQRMFDHLLLLLQTTDQWRAKEASHLPKVLHDELVAQYARHFSEWLCLPSGSSPSVSSPEKTGAAQTE